MDSTNGAGTTGHPHAKEQWWLGGNLDTDLTPFTKVNAKWIIASDGICNTVKVVDGNTGENLRDLRFSDNFEIMSTASSMKGKQ